MGCGLSLFLWFPVLWRDNGSSLYDDGGFKDVTVDCLQSPRILKIHLKSSKTDPFRVGVNVFVGRTGNSLCPVTTVLYVSYMVVRGSDSMPFFRFGYGKPLTRARFVTKVEALPQRVHFILWSQLQEWSHYHRCPTRDK